MFYEETTNAGGGLKCQVNQKDYSQLLELLARVPRVKKHFREDLSSDTVGEISLQFTGQDKSQAKAQYEEEVAYQDQLVANLLSYADAEQSKLGGAASCSGMAVIVGASAQQAIYQQLGSQFIAEYTKQATTAGVGGFVGKFGSAGVMQICEGNAGAIGAKIAEKGAITFSSRSGGVAVQMGTGALVGSGAAAGAGLGPGLVGLGAELVAGACGCEKETAKKAGFGSQLAAGAGMGACAGGPVGAVAGGAVAAGCWMFGQLLGSAIEKRMEKK